MAGLLLTKQAREQCELVAKYLDLPEKGARSPEVYPQLLIDSGPDAARQVHGESFCTHRQI